MVASEVVFSVVVPALLTSEAVEADPAIKNADRGILRAAWSNSVLGFETACAVSGAGSGLPAVPTPEKQMDATSNMKIMFIAMSLRSEISPEEEFACAFLRGRVISGEECLFWTSLPRNRIVYVMTLY